MKKALILILILAPLYAVHADLITLPNEPDVCSNIEGHQYPAPEGYHAESDGTCTLLQEPVHIDIVPPGGEPQSIDIVPPGGKPQVIDVDPPRSSSSRSSMSSETSTPKTITSLAELQTYVFDVNTTPEERTNLLNERVAALQAQLVLVLTQLVVQLQTQLAIMQ